MTSKEALIKLYFDNEDLNVDITLNDRKVCEIYNIIKQDLDQLEKFALENASLHTKIESLQSENKKLKRERAEAQQMAISLALGQDIQTFEKYEKLKKVIEILKKKQVSIIWLLMSDSVDRYNLVLDEERYRLTQEEYDLLKKEFGNE